MARSFRRPYRCARWPPGSPRRAGCGCTDGMPHWPLADLAAMDARAAWLQAAALASRLRPSQRTSGTGRRACWPSCTARSGGRRRTTAVRSSTSGRSCEALERAGARRRDAATSASGRPRISVRGSGGIRSSACGPRAERAARSRRLPDSTALRPSRRLWRARHDVRRALWSSADLRAAAAIDGCDCWPIVRERAGRRRAAAVAVVGTGDGRSGRRARRARPGGGADLRRGRRLGPRDHARVPHAAAFRPPGSSTASSIATG